MEIYRRGTLTNHFLLLWLGLIFLMPASALAEVSRTCPDIPKAGGFGPFDYQQPVKYARQLEVVERVHFTPDVESLKHGAAGSLAADLDYTVRAFPNHHRALDSMSRLSIKLNRPFIPGMNCSVDGFFERAIRFAPADPWVHLGYGVHLYRWRKLSQAEAEFLQADKMVPNDGNIEYNLGLLYVDLKEWDKAMSYAEKAYAHGFRLPGLRDMLISVGKWRPDKGDISQRTPVHGGEPPGKTNQ